METTLAQASGLSESKANGVGPPELPPLAVSGLLITKAALLAALAMYVPQITDVEAHADGNRFLLLLADTNQAQG